MSEPQAIIFAKSKFNTADARKWLKAHDYKPIKRVHATKSYLRYRLLDPHKPPKPHKYRTKQIAPGIKMILKLN